MTTPADERQFGRLAAPDVHIAMAGRSMLCLPFGSVEQHGPHLPLHTDLIIAERFSARLVGRYGGTHDLWTLPSLPYGLSLEHSWSAGTISLTVTTVTAILDAIVAEYVRATPARRLVIVNGHGGNRGILEAVTYELQRRHEVAIVVLHPSSLSSVKLENPIPEVHAGMRETSVMLALAPDQVHLDRLPATYAADEGQRKEINSRVLHRGTTWPWSSDDPAISGLGIIGSDPRTASADLGHAIIDSALDACADVLAHIAASSP